MEMLFLRTLQTPQILQTPRIAKFKLKSLATSPPKSITRSRNKTFPPQFRSCHQIQTRLEEANQNSSIRNCSLKRRVLQSRLDRCNMYGKKASELIKELDSCESGQLAGFNNDLFAQVIEECNGHLHQLQSLLRRIQEEGADSQATKNADHFGALIHHLSLVRNKRCLMAYVYNRAELIRSLGWTVERVLPEEIEEKLSSSEKDYFKNHSATLNSYMSDLDLDLSVDMVPPKDSYIKVRVLDEIGNVLLSDQSANLARHAILFLRRTDAEQYISQEPIVPAELGFGYHEKKAFLAMLLPNNVNCPPCLVSFPYEEMTERV